MLDQDAQQYKQLALHIRMSSETSLGYAWHSTGRHLHRSCLLKGASGSTVLFAIMHCVTREESAYYLNKLYH